MIYLVILFFLKKTNKRFCLKTWCENNLSPGIEGRIFYWMSENWEGWMSKFEISSYLVKDPNQVPPLISDGFKEWTSMPSHCTFPPPIPFSYMNKFLSAFFTIKYFYGIFLVFLNLRKFNSVNLVLQSIPPPSHLPLFKV